MPETMERSGKTDRPDKIRVSLDLTPEMKDAIDTLAIASGSTRADVLRRAVSLLKIVKEAEARDESPALIDEAGRVTARLIGI